MQLPNIPANELNFDGEEFEGYDLDILLGFMSIYQRYKNNVCFPTKEGKLMSINWENGEKLDIPDEIFTEGVCRERITIYPLVLYNEWDVYAHLNILVYDKCRKEIQRFDPNGAESDYNTFVLDEMLKFTIWEEIDSSINYVPADNICPIQRLQASQESSSGYCGAWCMWYLELRLTNIDKDPYEVERYAYRQLSERQNLLEFIRGYGTYLLNMKRYILKRVQEKFSVELNVFDQDNHYVKLVMQELLPVDDSFVELFRSLRLN